MRLDHTRPLTELMDFDRVIEIRTDGTIYDRHDVQAPELWDEHVLPGWELLNGYSGQDHYRGPIMHTSEQLDGRMESDIRSTPGIYVSLIAHYSDVDEDVPEDEPAVGGWAVARKI